ncbi:MAG: hypothetical protein QW727_01800 [Candidatus Pacearchaeota archaeon]
MEFSTIRRDNPLPKKSNECPDCKDTGIVKEPNGQVHTCWKCLQNGKLDAHSKSLPKNENIKL